MSDRKLFVSIQRSSGGVVVSEISYDLWTQKRPDKLVGTAIDALIRECDELDRLKERMERA